MKTLKIETTPKISIKNQMEELFKNSNINTFKEIKDPVSWQKSMRDEWN